MVFLKLYLVFVIGMGFFIIFCGGFVSGSDSDFGSMICFAFENSFNFQQLPLNNNINIISKFSRILKLNRIQEIAIACLLKNCNKRLKNNT